METRSVRLNSYLIRKFGIRKQNVFIKIKGYYIHCIPFELSLTECKALIVLSNKEMDFFNQFLEEKHKFHIRFFGDFHGRELSLYLWVKIGRTKLLKESGNMRLMEILYQKPPNDYKELLINHFLTEDSSRQAWEKHLEQNVIFNRQQLKQAGFGERVKIFNDQGFCLENCELIKLSYSFTEVLTDTSEDNFKKNNNNLQMEIAKKDRQIFIDIIFTDFQKLEQLPGFSSVKFEIPYTAELIEELSDCI